MKTQGAKPRHQLSNVFKTLTPMSRYKILDQHGLNFVTLTVVDWVDTFIRKSYKDIIIESLRHCQKEKGLIVYGYVIMSSHLHMIVEAGGSIPLSDILREFKKFTAKAILREIEHGGYESRKEWLLHRFAYRGHQAAGNRQYQFWQAESAILAHEQAFDFMGGVPLEIVYDQDKVFITDENHGDIILTQAFKAYTRER